jgi:hypothetical protein
MDASHIEDMNYALQSWNIHCDLLIEDFIIFKNYAQLSA